MNKVLIIFAHPRLEKSRINSRLVQSIPPLENITFHDLYECYPDFNVDIAREKSLLENHDVIIWHHPFYWYSAPPLLKQWIDMVLEYGWAYGTGGDKLKDKIVFNAITTGGNADAYCPQRYNCFTIKDFMHPFEQTARLCLMEYLPPFAVMGTHRVTEAQIERAADNYGKLLTNISKTDFDIKKASSKQFLNEMV